MICRMEISTGTALGLPPTRAPVIIGAGATKPTAKSTLEEG